MMYTAVSPAAIIKIDGNHRNEDINEWTKKRKLVEWIKIVKIV